MNEKTLNEIAAYLNEDGTQYDVDAFATAMGIDVPGMHSPTWYSVMYDIIEYMELHNANTDDGDSVSWLVRLLICVVSFMVAPATLFGAVALAGIV